MQKVGLIALRLGPVRTRDELLPFLANTIDEEELQICLSEELKKFVNLVGGPAYAHTLIVSSSYHICLTSVHEGAPWKLSPPSCSSFAEAYLFSAFYVVDVCPSRYPLAAYHGASCSS